ncbi:MAG: hypothetical protein J7J22_04845 [Candidatus Verstraetearchaeota archaeon]|nr:hypothetical protein [Candidatus Verstraetearchaeota archaeon]
MGFEGLALNFAKRITNNRHKVMLVLITINLLIALLTITHVSAQGETQSLQSDMKFFGAGLAVAGSCIGAGLALYGATSAGLAALTEKPGLAVWVLILAGLGEGVAIYGLIIAILILGA